MCTNMVKATVSLLRVYFFQFKKSCQSRAARVKDFSLRNSHPRATTVSMKEARFSRVMVHSLGLGRELPTSFSAVAAAAVATSSLCLQTLESLTIGSEEPEPQILPYERVVMTRFVQACCARLPRLHQLRLLFRIGYRSQREDYSGDLPLLGAMLASIDLFASPSSASTSTAAHRLFTLPSPSIRVLTLPRGSGAGNMASDLAECVIQNWVKDLDELKVPGNVLELKETLRTFIKKHHPHIDRLNLD